MQYQDRVQNILFFVYCGHAQCMGDDKRGAVCRVQTCQRDQKTHDVDAAASQDNSSACPT